MYSTRASKRVQKGSVDKNEDGNDEDGDEDASELAVDLDDSANSHRGTSHISFQIFFLATKIFTALILEHRSSQVVRISPMALTSFLICLQKSIGVFTKRYFTSILYCED
jgi:hypothetical protein